MKGLRCLVLAFSMLAAAGSAAAQSGPAGSLNGRVTDQSGGAVPGVTVTATNTATNDARTAVTSTEGVYQLSALTVGTYELAFQLDGFKSMRRTGVLVEAAVPRTIDVQLEVGGMTEQVNVTVESPVLQNTTPTVARRLSTEEITSVPSSTRSFTHLLTATAGVSADLPPVASNDTGAISPSVNGTKQTSNSVLYNGVDITSMLSNTGTLDEGLSPAPEMIEEVKLQTSLYDASTGRSGGGNFQLVTKSGANALNGSFYGFGQHERFNSNDFFFDRNGIEKPKMRRVESGFTLGGPLRRDRAFFFGSLQRTDAETGYVPTASSRALLPAALGLIQGDRTAEGIVSAFRQLNPGFALQPGDISPVALALLNARNPRTGDFIIPAPAGAVVGREPVVAIGAFRTAGGDPVAEHRQVIPADFRQLQGSARLDSRLTAANRLQLSYFGSDFPSVDPFPDPSTLASPFPLRKSNRGHVGSIGNTHVFGNVLNEARIGFFTLRNTRRLDDDINGVTSDQFGIVNPALLFDNSDATRRLGHFVNRGITWSFGAPNDAFNRREQQTVHFSDVVSATRGAHSIRVGGDFKLHGVKTNLPEEQGTEFEKIEHFQQFLLGFTSEADTQFGFTDKHFLMRDASWFVTDDWRAGDRLSVSMGVRWDWFGWPYEKNGYFGNFDPALVTDPSNPLGAIIVPSNIRNSEYPAVNAGIAAVTKVDSRHTLNGQDLNNFAPRLGFAYTASEKQVVRGGYGIFYDRPSAAFMNTVFSNYPILREIEITVPSRQVPIQDAFASNVLDGRPTPFDAFFPFRLVYSGGTNGSYSVRDGTGRVGVNGGLGNIAETLEFRAVDRDLETPLYQQWNLGWQWELAPGTALEIRYNGSRGHKLLLATALNEPWDLNDPETPQPILDRITAAYRAGGGTATPQDPDALGYGYGGNNNNGPGGAISSEVRTLYYGFNDAEALFLQSKGRSTYHALQTSVTKRFSRGYQFHAAYTYSVSKDLMSADPGSTAGGGRPDTPNSGFSVENDSRDLESNWAVSDFDRPHRFSLSGVWRLPLGGNVVLRDWEVATFMQFQSGRPFSVFRPEQGLLRLGFQRLDFAPGATAESVARQAASPEEGWFDTTQLRPAAAAGNTPRNFLRGPAQKRVDLSIARRIALGGRVQAELRWEIFNLLNAVNFALPENNFDSIDFGTITGTVGGPRVSQFGLRVTF
jgi:hypothetical protein